MGAWPRNECARCSYSDISGFINHTSSYTLVPYESYLDIRSDISDQNDQIVRRVQNGRYPIIQLIEEWVQMLSIFHLQTRDLERKRGRRMTHMLRWTPMLIAKTSTTRRWYSIKGFKRAKTCWPLWMTECTHFKIQFLKQFLHYPAPLINSQLCDELDVPSSLKVRNIRWPVHSYLLPHGFAAAGEGPKFVTISIIHFAATTILLWISSRAQGCLVESGCSGNLKSVGGDVQERMAP